MNESLILSHVANEIETMDESLLDQKLKAYAEGRLNQSEEQQLIVLGAHNPKIKFLVEAHKPLSEQALRNIEDNIMNTCFSEASEFSEQSDNISVDVSHKAASDRGFRKKNLINLFYNIVRKLEPLQVASCISIFLAVAISIYWNAEPKGQFVIPRYTLLIVGHNQDYRGDKAAITSATPSIKNENIDLMVPLQIYPQNEIVLQLRPEVSVAESLDVYVFAQNAKKVHFVESDIQRSSSGAFRIFPDFERLAPNAGTQPFLLTVVVAKAGSVSIEDGLLLLRDNRRKSGIDVEWTLMTQPINLHAIE